jgi:hypothetical protein
MEYPIQRYGEIDHGKQRVSLLDIMTEAVKAVLFDPLT